jgi:hypothetical protein
MSKSDNTTGNVAIGLGVVLLGFVVYKTLAATTTTTATQQATNATSSQGLSSSLTSALAGILKNSSLGTSTITQSLGNAIGLSLGDQTTDGGIEATGLLGTNFNSEMDDTTNDIAASMGYDASGSNLQFTMPDQ